MALAKESPAGRLDWRVLIDPILAILERISSAQQVHGGLLRRARGAHSPTRSLLCNVEIICTNPWLADLDPFQHLNNAFPWVGTWFSEQRGMHRMIRPGTHSLYTPLMMKRLVTLAYGMGAIEIFLDGLIASLRYLHTSIFQA